MNPMHTILGANGAIASGIVKELHDKGQKIRLVSRNPKKINDTDELFPADLLIAEQVMNAVKGSEVVYLTAGLKYKTKIWQEQWPVLMQNVINACKEHGAKLVFFDNVYSYGLVKGLMTENTPLNPVSKKGEVRAKLTGMLMKEMQNGLPVIIARAADFYGQVSPLSVMNVLVFEKIAKGLKPMLLAKDNTRHSLTYIPDAGKATAMLGMSATAWNQVWHAPTAAEPLTGKEIVETAYKISGAPFKKYQLMPKWMMIIAGIFVPVLAESVEMMYQNEYDYLFDSTKFNKAFHFEPTPYLQGIKETLNGYRNMM
jgi:nucleoside-diphosphate-sugar epimerase